MVKPLSFKRLNGEEDVGPMILMVYGLSAELSVWKVVPCVWTKTTMCFCVCSRADDGVFTGCFLLLCVCL